MRESIVCLIVGLWGAVGVARAQIPVTDAASIAQQVKQVASWAQQISAMKSQLDQQKQLFASMTGSRGIGNLLNNPALLDALPPDWQQVYQAMKNGGYSGLTGSAATIRSANSVFDACVAETGAAQTICQRSASKGAQDKAFAQTAYQSAQNRLANIQNLMGQIDNTPDPKAIADLQARIQTEQATIQNEQTKLQLFKMLADAEDKLIAQQQQELAAQRLARTGRTAQRLKLHDW